ncbi:membrane-bound oxidoreductase, partial [Streptomyces zinciresistens K42]
MTDDEKKRRRPLGPMRLGLGALSGALAGFAALSVAELVSTAVRPQAGPVVAVGGAAIDRTPAPVKDWAIRNFGTNDKLVLQIGILAVLAIFALALGMVALRYRRTGAAGVLVFGAVGAVAATGRPDSAGFTDALPSLAGAVAGALLLYVLAGRLTAPASAGTGTGTGSGTGTGTGADVDGTAGDGTAAEGVEPGWDRRGFVVAATAAAAASAGAGVLGRS